jgi:hypothetical protein
VRAYTDGKRRQTPEVSRLSLSLDAGIDDDRWRQTVYGCPHRCDDERNDASPRTREKWGFLEPDTSTRYALQIKASVRQGWCECHLPTQGRHFPVLQQDHRKMCLMNGPGHGGADVASTSYQGERLSERYAWIDWLETPKAVLRVLRRC